MLSGRIEHRLLRFLSRTLRFLHPPMKNFSRRFTQLLTLDNFRQNEQLSNINIARMLVQTLILKHSSLIILATLQLMEPVFLLQTAQLVGPIPKVGAFPPIGAHGPLGGGIWERLPHKSFKIWDISAASMPLQVWDAVAGRKQYTFEGHEAPVVDYGTSGNWCTMMAYGAGGTRLFSRGTSKEGESHLVEWNESEGAIKRTYSGFRKRSFGVVQFDTTRNRFLAAGDEFQIKFWDMDNTNMLTAVDVDDGLPICSRTIYCTPMVFNSRYVVVVHSILFFVG
ncbi:hypothetical protein Patl1_24458 [Pistacia atlantica]|uniref:Uncharacterized protein n=1 Tax=Pistacia atlantica TaxID=434234 RepID=A0ACC1A2V9_9ROSI|nr:hypothetical protein Patl1_24458 [Pistacia atlantica]